MTERMMMLAFQLGLILFAARLGGMLFNQMKLPGVLGELLSGIIVGPFALGQITLPGFPHGLFPMAAEGSAVTPELYGFGAVAAIILLFDVGLETDLKMLIRYSVAGMLVGLGGVIFSFAAGAWVTSLLSAGLLGAHLPILHPVCLFMGVVSTATSVGITARVLSERRQLDSPEGITILSAAVVDDVIGIILLAVVLGIVASTAGGGSVNWGGVGMIGLKAVGIWLVSSVAGILASRKISLLLKYFRDPVAIAVMSLGLALILAGLFEHAGLAMIIGAYIMGLSLSRTDIRCLVREKLHPVYVFFVPVFFCITGMQINLLSFFSLPVIGFGLVFTVAAFLSKLLGCGLPALIANFNGRGALRVGMGMVPRGEVGLIVAGIGAGVALMPDGKGLPDALFASVVLMVMASTIAAPPLLAELMKNPARGIRKERPGERGRQLIEFDLVSDPMADLFMQKLRTEFESEGFFWHRLDREQRLYQLRKDGMVIDLSQTGTKLCFSISSAEAGMIRTMMLEAAASFEDALRGLQQPFDAKTISHNLLDDDANHTAVMNLSQILTENHIQPQLRSRTREEVIEELLEILLRAGEVSDVEAARAALWERERKMSTALESGVAIPHAKTDAVGKLVCAIGISRDGIDCESMDGSLSRIFVMTLSPINHPTPHIQFMAAVSRLLNETGRMYLLDGRTEKEILAYMTQGTGHVRRSFLPERGRSEPAATGLTP